MLNMKAIPFLVNYHQHSLFDTHEMKRSITAGLIMTLTAAKGGGVNLVMIAVISRKGSPWTISEGGSRGIRQHLSDAFGQFPVT